MMIVSAGLLLRRGRVLVGRRRPGKPYSGYWEFPGGKVEKGESLRQCVEREFQEEMGLVVSAGPLVSENIYEYSNGPVRINIFEVRCFDGEPQMLEHDRLDWVKPGKLDALHLLPGNLAVAPQIKNYFKGSREAENFSDSEIAPS
ncbi:MAG: (deoxy)nucleoside triphosphate pyrophosphohydrolase [Elusimicrobia bacterium]|nr:(deoxy)nucleoside triphosphate pyrophosphohydrolase [Elusimicrobiota bacterium]